MIKIEPSTAEDLKAKQTKSAQQLKQSKEQQNRSHLSKEQQKQEEFDIKLAEILEKLNITQDKIKRDPTLYGDEFRRILGIFQVIFDDFLQSPNKQIKGIKELILFFAHVSHVFPKEISFIPFKLITLIENNYSNISPEIRFAIVEALSLLRKKDLLEAVEILPLFFKLLKCQDKELRKKLQDIIITDMTRINKNHKNNAINKKIQNFCYEMLKDPNKKAARKTLNIIVYLYKKKIWNEPKTVNSISSGCFSNDLKIVFATCRFFLSEYKEEDPESDDEESLDELKNKYKLLGKGNNKKTKARKSKVKKLIKAIERRGARKARQKINKDFMPIDLLNDPHTFCEKLFSKLKSIGKNDNVTRKFKVKVIVMRLLGRIIGRHKLMIHGFYSEMLKYLEPANKELGTILVALIEACHELLPSNELDDILRKLFDNFIAECISPETITIGLNTLREISERMPHIVTNQAHVDYVNTFRHFKNKSVATAARGYINLVKEVNPSLLKIYEKDQPKGTNAFGQGNTSGTLEGLDLYKKYEHIPDDYRIEYEEVLDNLAFKKMRLLKMKQEAEKIQNHKVNLNEGDINKMLDLPEQKQKKNKTREDEDEGGDEEDYLSMNEEGEDIEDDSDMQEIDDEDIEGLEEIEGEEDEDGEENEEGDEEEGEDIDDIEGLDDELENLGEDIENESYESEDEENALHISSDELVTDPENEDDDEKNIHGFLNPEDILTYKKTYGEKKPDIKNQKKEEFIRNRKQKGGGTTNKEKNKLKPMMMVIGKKKREVSDKLVSMNKKIKNIKKHLGRFKRGNMILQKKGQPKKGQRRQKKKNK